MKSLRPERTVFREGKRIYLRPPFTDDVCHLVKWFNDYQITRFLSCRLPITEAEERAWVDGLHNNPDQLISFIIVLKKKGGGESPLRIAQLERSNCIRLIVKVALPSKVWQSERRTAGTTVTVLKPTCCFLSLPSTPSICGKSIPMYFQQTKGISRAILSAVSCMKQHYRSTTFVKENTWTN